MTAFDRLLARAARQEATFRLTVRPGGFVAAYWGWGRGYRALRVSDRWRGPEGVDALLRDLELRLPEVDL